MPADVCTCGPERDKADAESRARGVPVEMLWFCLDCGRPRPGTPVAPGGEAYEPVEDA